MLKRARTVFEGIYFSLPIQLIVFQVRDNKSILVWWLLLFLMVNNSLGTGFGLPFLFLEPEYLGQTSFWSMLLMGAGLAAFFASYQIAIYVLDSYRFHFLALEENPFHIFYINNSILPASFILFYTYKFIAFQIYIAGTFTSLIFWEVAGLYLGLVAMLFLIALYFYLTNQNIFKVFGMAIAHELKRPKTIINKAKSSMNVRNRIDSYFKGNFSIEHVDKTLAPDFRSLVRILNQNHGNALFLELMLLISIIALGLGEDIPFLQIPAGASVLLTFSVFLMFVGAFTFWFRKIGPLAFVIIILALVSLDRFGFFDGRHQALGMNYDKIEPYTAETLNRHTSEHTLYSDYLNTVTILNKWKDSYQAFHGVNKKPKAILVCVSGGGLRSSYFTFRSIQILDSMSHGAFFDHTRMISGASGGILGASYFRELYWLNKRGLTENIYEKSKSDPIVKDLLNRIAFKIVSGIFLPHLSENIGSRSYASDRGYSLDDQVMANIPLLRNRRLGDYTQPESEALIPMLIMSPVIINDGRKLFISSTPVSYMTRTVNPSEGVGLGVTGVEFRRFFKNQEPDSLLFVTAFRMNASFPGITPFVSLPSEPPLKLIDAGVADNFGITVAMRFLYVFREWFAANTEGVMILQIRDTERETVARNYHKKSLIGKMMDPLGAFYNAYTQSRDLANEDFLNFSGGLFKGKLQFTSIQYVPEDSAGTKASLSWHLTARERDYIEHSTRQPRNQEVFQYVTDWIKNAEKGGIGHFSFRMEERDSATGK